MVKITATFLDEITHDIPSLNYTEEQWDREFALMKSVGIDTAVMIRCGHRNFMTFPSRVLQEKERAFVPPVDMLEMFLRLCEKHGVRFFFGTYIFFHFFFTYNLTFANWLNTGYIFFFRI